MRNILLKLNDDIISTLDCEVSESKGAYVNRTHLLRQLIARHCEQRILAAGRGVPAAITPIVYPDPIIDDDWNEDIAEGN